ncbi:MAG: lactonase family protein [Lachnospiraceae bacterium]|nr:lactonase family protein [Lachnospiraceae bacterium]
MSKTTDDRYVGYAGTYTHGSSKGIHIFDVDVEKGLIHHRKEIEINNPSFLTLSSNEKVLYSICDEGVTAFKILEDGDLEFMNTASIKGMRGCHLSTNKAGTFLFVSGYHDGKITVMNLNPDGSIGSIADGIFHKSIGAVSNRNYMPHVNFARLTPDEKFLCVCDLGIDQIKLYQLSPLGKLKLVDVIRTQLDSAPRNINFSPDGKFAYVVCELKNIINVYRYDYEAKNKFEFIQSVFTVRSQNKINTAAATLLITPDGKNVFCSNAGDNSITFYDRNEEDGTLTPKSCLPVSGSYPKNICLFPDGKHLMSLNHEASTITTFTLDYEKHLLIMNGPITKIDTPNNIVLKKL